MAEAFDPYHIWLGIAPEEQPPHYYRLLGVKPFETNTDALESAADQRMVHLRSFQTGKHAADSQKLLNELAAARLCLLSPDKRQAYDRELKAKLAADKPPTSPSRPAVAKPLVIARPLAVQPAATAAGPMAELGFDPLAESTARRTPKKRTAKPSPAIYAIAGLALLAVIAVAWIAIGSGDDDDQPIAARDAQTPSAASNSGSGPKQNPTSGSPGSTPQNVEDPQARSRDDSNTSDDSPETSASVDDSREPNEPIDEETDADEMALVLPDSPPDAAADDLPDMSQDDRPSRGQADDAIRSVTADKLVLWNTHNNDWNDRGMQSCNVELRKAGQVVWSQKAVPVPWKNNEDPATTVPLPKIAFDTVRVETASFQGLGTGLCEVEVFRGKTNLARGKPVTASGSHDAAPLPEALVDGIRESSRRMFGYWLGPDRDNAWIEVLVGAPAANKSFSDESLAARAARQSSASGGVIADKLVLWDCHNNHWRDRGMLSCTIELKKGGQVVWSKPPTPLEWSLDAELPTTIRLPKIAFDTVRVTTASYYLQGSALCEIEVFRGSNNLARGKPVTVSASHVDSPPAATLIDGIKDSSQDRVGYWAAPNYQRAWAEVQLVTPVAASEKTVFLADLPVAESQIHFAFPLSHPCPVGGVTSPHSLFMHAKEMSTSHAAYALDKKFQTLSGMAAICDTAGSGSTSPLTFRLVGDGKELWRATLQKPGSTQGFDVRVARVGKLELFVDCPGIESFGHAAWVDLKLTRAGAAANSRKPSADKPKQKTTAGKANDSVVADKLVIWNCNNNHRKDRGMLSCNVELLKSGQVVWSKKAVPLAWSETEEPATTILLPKASFDCVRVEAVTYQGKSPALCEIEVFQGGTNIARGHSVRASATLSAPFFSPAAVVDGITNSERDRVGYWTAPDEHLAWIEVQIAQPNAEGNDVTIKKAVYGLGPKQVDITEQLQTAISSGRYVTIQADPRVFGDPAPFASKRLVVTGTVGTNPFSLDLDESQLAPLPNFPAEGTKVTGASNRFAVVAAMYGAGSTWKDITAAVANGVGDPKTPFDPNVFTRDLPDPWFGIDKHVVVWFDHRGLRYVRTFGPSESRPLLP